MLTKMCDRPRPEPIYIPGSRTHQRTERPRCSRQDPAGATVPRFKVRVRFREKQQAT